MPIQELVVRFKDNIWQVSLGDHLLSGLPTQMAAIGVAHTIAHAAAGKGIQTKIRVVDVDGSSLEFQIGGNEKLKPDAVGRAKRCLSRSSSFDLKTISGR